ncbi:YfgM family protein [Acinetobacter lanii]|uniref:Heme biosynthesis protein HemY n=1 Tax=Acinetobacter lanii TaxID=2715163 RepID=A0A6G8S793_9GAMM|nr:heme biosynthesis protein HemY [Acinetobacter lanii]QIO10055.1 heme biosynthesis protein HemY [Acinetobacter lanii]
MKHIVLVYSFIALILIALLSVLSYGAGSGYVYVLWHGIQIQTNMWFLVLGALLVGLVFQIAWMWLKRYVNREKRKIQHVVNFSELHSYEQLGVLWLLGGKSQQAEYLQPSYAHSGLLQQVMQSRVLVQQGLYNDALKVLEKSPADAFELAEIQRVEIYLAQQDGEQALTHLEFLSGHALSPWLNALEPSYKQRLITLWGQFATQFPWLYLKSTHYGHLQADTKQNWLTQLLLQFEQASTDDIQRVIDRYQQQQQQIQSLSFETKVLWLKLLSRIPEMAEQHGLLALELLNERFDQDVFYLWFQQQLLKQNPDYAVVEQQINTLENKYPSMPIFAFALWHVYMSTQREQAAKQLLLLYPDNILMNYLRIKSTFHGDEVLIQQLNSVFEKDADFIHLKI